MREAGVVQTVTGAVPVEALGITDAHNHLWIEPVPGSAPDSPVLTQRAAIERELAGYRATGGRAIVDCQPGGCGRNGTVLLELAQATGVHVVACTGFHRRRYYPADYWLWSASETRACDLFTSELTNGLAETRESERPVLAGFIKLACEASLEDTPQAALAGAAAAAAQTGAAIEIHTEKGAAAEAIVQYFAARGVPPQQLVVCHVDKRPDFGLHRELIQAGVVLEYDTFYRPKYNPEQHLWPLLDQIVAAGLDHGVALATDLAEADGWREIAGGPGLASLPGEIQSRLRQRGVAAPAITNLIGSNIARRLSGLA